MCLPVRCRDRGVCAVPVPTHTCPGSADRLDVLAGRAACRLSLFVPGDALRHERRHREDRSPGGRRRGGVSWYAAKRRWIVRVTVEGVRHFLGLFVTREQGERRLAEWLAAPERQMA